MQNLAVAFAEMQVLHSYMHRYLRLSFWMHVCVCMYDCVCLYVCMIMQLCMSLLRSLLLVLESVCGKTMLVTQPNEAA